MDLGSFVQENRRWLIGCAVGVVVWLIAGAVVDAMVKPNWSTPPKVGALPGKIYGKEALTAATAEHDALAAQRTSLQQELTFVLDKKFELDGKGAHDMAAYQAGLSLKQGIVAAASERMVQCNEAGITWEIPTTPDDTRGMLFGLAVLEQLTQRLFAAHDAVRQATPEALGLRAITALKLDARRGQRGAVRPVRPGEIDLRQLLQQEQVSFTVQADEATLLRWLESFRQPGATLVVDSWQIQQPTRRGEPCTAKGTVLGIQCKQAQPAVENP